MQPAAEESPVSRWLQATKAFPNIDVDAVRRAGAKLPPDSPEAAEAAVIEAICRGDMAALARFVHAAEQDSKTPSVLGLKLAAVHYLANVASTKVAGPLTLRADDTFRFAAIQAWRYQQSVRLKRKPDVRLAVVAALKDEAEYMEEWLAFHAIIGVERFYLYENHSTDTTLEVLKRLSSSYDIRLHSFQQQPAQMLAYNDFLRKYSDEVEWAAFIDADEFIRPARNAPRLHDLLDQRQDAAAIALNWTLYGSSGHVEAPSEIGLKAFQRSAGAPSRIIKSIVRPDQVILMPTPHVAVMNGKYVTPSGRACLPFRDVVELSGLADEPYGLAHYAVRSREQYARKRQRGESDGVTVRDDTYFPIHDRNEVEDTTMAVWAPAVEKLMATVREKSVDVNTITPRPSSRWALGRRLKVPGRRWPKV